MRVYSAMAVARLSPQTRALLDTTCARHGVRVSEFVREAILAKLETAGANLPAEACRRRLSLHTPAGAQ